MDELATRFPDDVKWAAPYDPTVFVRDSIKAVVQTLLEAVFLVVLVVILFLQTWRASIIPCWLSLFPWWARSACFTCSVSRLTP